MSNQETENSADSGQSDSNALLGNDIETEGMDYPVCPNCGQIDQDWWNGLESKNDGDEWSSCCGSCSTDYTVTLEVSHSFDTHIVPNANVAGLAPERDKTK